MSTLPDEVSQTSPPISTATRTRTPVPGRGSGSSGLFRACWRWHFYASLLVLPVMFMLAVTGLVILYQWQLDPAVHRGVLTVEVPAHAAPKPLSLQEAAVRAAHPAGTITAVQEGAENRATFFTVAEGDDVTRNVYVNPYTATVTGELAPESQLSNIATDIHGQIVFGKISTLALGTDPAASAGLTATEGSDDRLTAGVLGDRIIELASCWAIVMTLTGYYLYFRGRTARLRRVAARARAASLRNNHARLGAILGVGFLLLVVSGLPWTGLWGNVVQKLATGQGSSLWGDDPGAESTLAQTLVNAGSDTNPPPWAEGAGTVPQSEAAGSASSGAHAGHGGGTASSGSTGSVSIDTVVATARADGAAQPYYITYPTDEKGVFSVLADQWHDKANPAFTNVNLERTVHVDQYSGEVAGRYAYDDYSTAAKVVSQGIALHEGRRLGSFNLVASTAFCLGVIFLCITGPLMWWKRRPAKGGLAAPRGRMPLRATPLLGGAIVVLGVLMPLFGLSVLVVLAVDLLVRRRVTSA